MSCQSLRCLLLGTLLLVGCSKSLDSVDGPTTGKVQGVVCGEISVSQAVEEVPAVKAQLVKEGKCAELRSPAQVTVIRTVMMPGKGRYTQFSLDGGKPAGDFWIRTDKIRP